jgi:hypothetical protein
MATIETQFLDACYRGDNKKVIELWLSLSDELIERGAYSAINGNQPEILEVLLTRLSEVTPMLLSVAIFSDDLRLVQAVVESGKIEIAINHLRYAILRRQLPVIEYLAANSLVNFRKHYRGLVVLSQELGLTTVVSILEKYQPARL